MIHIYEGFLVLKLILNLFSLIQKITCLHKNQVNVDVKLISKNSDFH